MKKPGKGLVLTLNLALPGLGQIVSGRWLAGGVMMLLAVAVDDRLAFFENGIEKRGFADVWSADDGDGRQRICLSLLFTHGHVPYFCRRSGGRPRCR